MGLPSSSLSLMISMVVSAPGTISHLAGFNGSSGPRRLGDATGFRIVVLAPALLGAAAAAVDAGAGAGVGAGTGAGGCTGAATGTGASTGALSSVLWLGELTTGFGAMAGFGGSFGFSGEPALDEVILSTCRVGSILYSAAIYIIDLIKYLLGIPFLLGKGHGIGHDHPDDSIGVLQHSSCSVVIDPDKVFAVDGKDPEMQDQF